jgi:rubredoxin
MKYVCQLCGYVYDEDEEKVPFAELPEDWTCPLCGAGKDEFQPEE